MVKTLRVTDRYQPLTDLRVIRITKWDRREIGGAFNFQNRQIQFIACAKHFGFIWLFCILHRYLNNIRVMHHMFIS
ncbi:hypothetical protein D3C78_1778460 [compost metagenome]